MSDFSDQIGFLALWQEMKFGIGFQEISRIFSPRQDYHGHCVSNIFITFYIKISCLDSGPRNIVFEKSTSCSLSEQRLMLFSTDIIYCNFYKF